jgi:hypothetical protein
MPANRRARWRALGSASFVAPAVLLLGALLPASASAAAQAATVCSGGLTKDPAASTSGDPNLTDYSFDCNGAITAYSVVINRTIWDFETVDDFSTTANVTKGGVVVPTESFGCEGVLPGNGINCNGSASAYNLVDGSFDTSGPFCGGYGAHAKWPAKPAPQAFVQLVVTDSSGAQDGPFRLNITPGCPYLKPLPKPKTKQHGKAKPPKRGKAKPVRI